MEFPEPGPGIRARDHILASCARNVWLLLAMFNISNVVSHVKGIVADLISKWQGSTEDNTSLFG